MAIPKRPPEEILDYIWDNFDYEPISGNLYRFSKKWNSWIICQSAHETKRLRVGIKYKTYYVANICWFLYYREWPEIEIDHKDLDGFNNKIDNLRLSNFSENSRNTVKKKNNKYIGVSFHTIGSKWRYRFSISGKLVEVYGFNTAKEAAKAREEHLDRIGDVFCARNKDVE